MQRFTVQTVENVLNDCGMSDAWLSQCNGINNKWLKSAIKTRLRDQFVQETNNLIATNSKCLHYKNIKEDHKFEDKASFM